MFSASWAILPLSQCLNSAVVVQKQRRAFRRQRAMFQEILFTETGGSLGQFTNLCFRGKKYAKIEDTLMVYCYRNKTVPYGINMVTLTLYFKGQRELCQHFNSRFPWVVGLKVINILFTIFFCFLEKIKKCKTFLMRKNSMNIILKSVVGGIRMLNAVMTEGYFIIRYSQS